MPATSATATRSLSASWSSAEQPLDRRGERTDTGERRDFTAGFLWMCQGYYRHARATRRTGRAWPTSRAASSTRRPGRDDLDLKGKKVIVIGSGATAATLIPAIADDCAHVTMLQRSPTYFVPGRNVDDMADQLRAAGDRRGRGSTRSCAASVLRSARSSPSARFEEPEAVKQELLAGVSAFIGAELDREALHAELSALAPAHRLRAGRRHLPEDQGRQGHVVTDEIERFTENGIRLKSGEELEADVVITATGFNLTSSATSTFAVDGKPLDFAETVTYRGMMFTGVPNMVWVFGYFRASWTLRADLIADFVCRLLKHMDEAKGAQAGRRSRCARRTRTWRWRAGSTRRTSIPAT